MRKTLTFGLVVLAILNIVSFSNSIQTREQLSDLKSEVSQLPKSPVVYNGADGYTPKKGIDYRDGADGKPGINATSFNTVIVKEVPLAGLIGADGKDGVDGQDAPIQYSRVNPETGDFETRLSTWRTWSVETSCVDLAAIWKIECPSAD